MVDRTWNLRRQILRLSSVCWALVPAVVLAAPIGDLPPQQESDDVTRTLVPAKPRDAAEETRMQAASWFMTGRLHETRGQTRKAYDAFKKAVELSPRSIEIYRELVPLAFQLDDVEAAIQYATKAVEIDGEDVQLLQQLATSLVNQRRVPEAIKYLEQAAASTKLDQKSETFVMLSRTLGVLYKTIGETGKAADRFAVLLNALQHPNDYDLDVRTRTALLSDRHTGLESIGEAMIAANRPEEAGRAFDFGKEVGKISAGHYSFYKAKVLLMSEKADEALTTLQPYFDAQRQSKGAEAYQLLADILAKQGKSAELIGRIETLAKEDPRNRSLQYFLAEQLAAAGELERAKETYDQALKGSNDMAGLLGLADVLRRMDRMDELLEVLAKAVSRANPDSLDQLGEKLEALTKDGSSVDKLVEVGRAAAKAEPSQLTFEKCYLIAKLAGELEKFDAASEFYALAVPLARQKLQLVYTEWGQMNLQAQRYAEAVKVYREALDKPQLADFRPNLLYVLSQALEMNDETDEALKAIGQAMSEIPDNPALLFQEAWIYYHAHRFDEAITRFEKIMEKFAENKEVIRRCQFSLSNIYVLQGDKRRGEEILEKVFAEEPDNVSVNNDLGYLYADQGKNLELAEKMIRKAIAAEPENSAYLDSLGWVLFKLGRYEEALVPLEQAVAKSTGSGDATLWFHLGDCYQALKKMDKAVESWRKALQHAEKDKHPEQDLLDAVKMRLKQHDATAEKPASAKESAQ